MTIRRQILVFCALAAAAASHGRFPQAEADEAKIGRVNTEAKAVTPAEMKWGSQGQLAMAGMEQVNLVGNPSEPGPYTLRLKFPAGYKLGPHMHPDSREVTILSGTWYTGYGEKFDVA